MAKKLPNKNVPVLETVIAETPIVVEPETTIPESTESPAIVLSEALELHILGDAQTPQEPSDDDVMSYAKINNVSIVKASMALNTAYEAALNGYTQTRKTWIEKEIQAHIAPILFNAIKALGIQAISIGQDGMCKFHANVIKTELPIREPGQRGGPTGPRPKLYKTPNGVEWTGIGFMKNEFVALLKSKPEFSTWTDERIKQSFSTEYLSHNRTKEDHDKLKAAMEQYKIK